MSAAPSTAPSAVVWRPAATEPEALLRRALLRAGMQGAPLQDLIDCADLTAAIGLPQEARALYGLIFLQIGFSPEGLTFQSQAAARTGLWTGAGGRPEPGSAAPRAFSVDIALAELRTLMRLEPRPDLGSELASIPPAAEPPSPFAPRAAAPISGLLDRLQADLGAVPELQREGRLASALRDLREESLSIEPVRLEEHLDEPTPRLALLLALRGLQRFLLETAELLAASPGEGLFHEAGRLSPAGLGPYFANVRLVIRGPGDVFALIEAAAERPLSEAEVEAWALLLSARMQTLEMADFADEVGQRGMIGVLRALLARSARWSRFEPRRELAWRIRDAGLDLGDLELAAAAQRLAAHASLADALQWSILGDILGTLGDMPAAEAAFEHSLRVDPDDADARERLAALRSRRFEWFEASGGVLNPSVRRRLRRLAAPPPERR